MGSRRFQQPRSKMTMNVDASSDDSCRKFILPLFLCSSLLHLRLLGTAPLKTSPPCLGYGSNWLVKPLPDAAPTHAFAGRAGK